MISLVKGNTYEILRAYFQDVSPGIGIVHNHRTNDISNAGTIVLVELVSFPEVSWPENK